MTANPSVAEAVGHAIDDALTAIRSGKDWWHHDTVARAWQVAEWIATSNDTAPESRRSTGERESSGVTRSEQLGAIESQFYRNVQWAYNNAGANLSEKIAEAIKIRRERIAALPPLDGPTMIRSSIPSSGSSPVRPEQDDAIRLNSGCIQLGDVLFSQIDLRKAIDAAMQHQSASLRES